MRCAGERLRLTARRFRPSIPASCGTYSVLVLVLVLVPVLMSAPVACRSAVRPR
jgi:hypothetical protein